MQGWRTQFIQATNDDWYRPDRWPDFGYSRFAACFILIPAVAYFATFVPLYGLSVADILEAQRRIFTENSSFHPPHPYMSSWPTWPLLMRPIWYQFDKIADDRVQAIIFLGNPLILWPALAALGICLRDWIVLRRADAFLILSFYLGPWLAWAALPRTISFIYYYLPSATVATLALVYVLTRGERPQPRWLLWAFVAAGFAGFVVLLPISVAGTGTSMETYYRLMIFKSWI
jgi:dolichyl-phosphate-mannose--protein O-mannosyl transferase